MRLELESHRTEQVVENVLDLLGKGVPFEQVALQLGYTEDSLGRLMLRHKVPWEEWNR